MVSRSTAGIEGHVGVIVVRAELVSAADTGAHHHCVGAALGLPGSTPTATLIEAWQIEGGCG